MVQKYDGGLKMPDIYSIHATHKLLWIKRLMDETNRKWKTLTKALLGISSEFLHFKLLEKLYIQCAETKYYQQLLDFWYSFKNRAPTCAEGIKYEFLLYNRYISVGGSCLMIRNKIWNYNSDTVTRFLWSTGSPERIPR